MSGDDAICRPRAAKLFDAHCHLQDKRIASVAPKMIREAVDSGVRFFAVNGVSEEDWQIVKQMGDEYASVIPCFGLHPWYIAKRSPNWFRSLKESLAETPTAAVGEIGLDKGAHAQHIDFSEQLDIFERQLELAKALDKPASVHCVGAFEELIDIMSRTGPFPAGVILHSFMGSAEMVPVLAELGSYFSFSGHNTSMNPQSAKKILESVPKDRILIETDAPDGLPRVSTACMFPVPGVASEEESEEQSGNSEPASVPAKEELNHPRNVHIVLKYITSVLEMPEEEVAGLSFQNASRLFTYPGSKVTPDC